MIVDALLAHSRSLAVAIVAIAQAAAQCSTNWLPGSPLPGVDGRVNAMVQWDPDGAGPTTPVIVVGGDFTVAGSVESTDLATFDPVTGAWAALGPMATYWDHCVSALAVLPTGELVVAGRFISVAGVTTNCIASWNGSTWSSLGGPVSRGITALVALPNGDLVAAGDYPWLNPLGQSSVLRWDASLGRAQARCSEPSTSWPWRRTAT